MLGISMCLAFVGLVWHVNYGTGYSVGNSPFVKSLGRHGCGKAIVVYFSRPGENYKVGYVRRGNTEKVARIISGLTGADLFRIETKDLYPDSYDEAVQIAKQQKETDARPELRRTVENFDDYEVVFLGYPIWNGDMPMPVYTFLDSHDMDGKAVIAFVTHEGSGFAGTDQKLNVRYADDDVRVLQGFSVTGTDAQTKAKMVKNQLKVWLADRVAIGKGGIVCH